MQKGKADVSRLVYHSALSNPNERNRTAARSEWNVATAILLSPLSLGRPMLLTFLDDAWRHRKYSDYS